MYGKLNDTEKTILKLIGKGFTNQEISENLNKSENTINTYIYHLAKQYSAKNRIDLFNKTKGELKWIMHNNFSTNI